MNRSTILRIGSLILAVLLLASLLTGCGKSGGDVENTPTLPTLTAESDEDLAVPESSEDLSEALTEPVPTTTEAEKPTAAATEETEDTGEAPEEPEEPMGFTPFVRKLEDFDRLVMTKAEMPLYAVPRRDAQDVGLLWEHQGLVVLYGGTVRTEDGTDSDWYLVRAYNGELNQTDEMWSAQGWVPVEAVTAWDEAAEQPRNAAYGLAQNAVYYEDGEECAAPNYVSTSREDCWFLAEINAATGRLTLVNWQGRSIEVADRTALRPYGKALPITWTSDVVPEAFPNEYLRSGQSFPQISPEAYRQMLEQDEEERSAFDPSVSGYINEWIGHTELRGLVEPMDSGYRAVIVHTVPYKASEEDMELAKETGWLKMDGGWALYCPPEYDNYSEDYHGERTEPALIHSGYGTDGELAQCFDGNGRDGSYFIEKYQNEYIFVNGVDRFDWRLERVTGVYWLRLDPDTPVHFDDCSSNSENNGLTVTPLKDSGRVWASADTSLCFDEEGNLYIYEYYDGK